jgi:hypothetical protein
MIKLSVNQLEIIFTGHLSKSGTKEEVKCTIFTGTEDLYRPYAL